MQIITREQDLVRFIDKAMTQAEVACDTEFVRVRTYWPELALIQMATPEGAVLVDPLEIKDFSSIKTLFEAEHIVKIFHAPRQDLELMRHSLDIKPVNIFDTQVAAAMLGGPDQIGYEGLVREILEIQLDKSAQFTDWLVRPLSPEQLTYAAADVTHLLEIYHLMTAKLGRRHDWVRELCAPYASDALFEPDLKPLFMKWAPRLRKEDHRVRLWLGLQWREARAQKINRPRPWILKDADLLQWARGESEDPPHGLARALKGDLEEAKAQVALMLHEAQRPLSGKQKEHLEATKQALNAAATAHDLPARYIASKDEIERYVRTRLKPVGVSDWKNELFWNTLSEDEGQTALCEPLS